MQIGNGNSFRLRLAAGFVLATALALMVLRVISGQQSGEAALPMVAGAAVYLMLGVGLGSALAGLAALLEQRTEPARPPNPVPGISLMQDAIIEIRDELRLLRSNVAAELAQREEELEDRRNFAPPAPLDPQSLQPVLQMLEEIRELSLMNEQQRQERLTQLRPLRKRARLRTAQEAIAAGDFARAHRICGEVRQFFPDDPDLHQVETELRIARSNAEGDSLDRLRREVEDLIALSQWDQALQKARDFAAAFPDNAEGRSLLERVTRERDLFRDSTAERMYHEIREHLEHREWQWALSEAERLLEQFPDHKRAARIHEQMDLIRENAQIQERKETEERIEELIRGKRFSDAIELAEDLIQRYPDSPQAATLTEMLPRLRERAIKDEFAQS